MPNCCWGTPWTPHSAFSFCIMPTVSSRQAPCCVAPASLVQSNPNTHKSPFLPVAFWSSWGTTWCPRSVIPVSPGANRRTNPKPPHQIKQCCLPSSAASRGSPVMLPICILHKTPLTSYKLPMGSTHIQLKATEHMIGVVANSGERGWACSMLQVATDRRKTSQFKANGAMFPWDPGLNMYY